MEHLFIMANLDWNYFGECEEEPIDVFIKKIKQEAKEHIGGVDKSINSLDLVVHCYKKWRTSVLLGLCPECRYKLANTQKSDTTSSPVDGNPTIENLKLIIEIKENVFKRNYEEMELKTKELKVNITNLKEKTELLQSKLALNALEYQRTLGDVDKFRVENEQLKFKLATLDVDKLKVAVVDCDDGLAETDHCAGDNKEANAEMKLLLEEFTITNQKLTDQITDLKNQLAQERSKTCEHEILLDTIENLKSDLTAKDERLCRIQKELDEAKQQRKREIVLGIRSERSGMGKTMVEMVIRELTDQLKNTLDRQDIRLTVKQCQTSADIPRGMMAVLCLDISRVGTNIRDALAGVKVNRDVFVIVFHHTSKENLSSLTPTSLRITGNDLRQLGAIIDMVFSSDGGIYACGLNSSAVASIATLISRYS